MTTTVPVGVGELAEIRAYCDFVGGAPAPVREELGIGVRGVGGSGVGSALAITASAEATNFFNRAGGFDAGRPIDEQVVAQVVDFFRARGVREGSFMVAPSLLPANWDSIAERFKLTEGTRFVKLGADVEVAARAAQAAKPLDPGLRVGRVEPDRAREWATVMMPTLGFATPAMVDVAQACVGRANWRQYAVCDGERIVGVGSVFVDGQCADMFGGATLGRWRGRGVQSALLAARVRGAREAGCRWIVAEAFAEGPGEHNSSLHNMMRAGFERLYDRVAWTWRP